MIIRKPEWQNSSYNVSEKSRYVVNVSQTDDEKICSFTHLTDVQNLILKSCLETFREYECVANVALFNVSKYKIH